MIKRNPPERKRVMRKRDRTLDKKMAVPGAAFLEQMIPGSTPLVDGVYLAYYDPQPPHAHSNVKRSSGMAVVSFKDGRWGYNHRTLAYLGPIPSLSLESLQTYTPPYLLGHSFFNGNLEDAAKGYYDHGPWPQYILAYCTPGREGDFIFYMTTDEGPIPISKYVQKKKDHYIWKTMSQKDSKKYQARMESLK